MELVTLLVNTISYMIKLVSCKSDDIKVLSWYPKKCTFSRAH